MFKRLSAAFLLKTVIAGLAVVLSIGLFGPRTSNLELEKISH